MSPEAPPQLYLASASPRRRELLEQLGLRFVVLPVEVDEVRAPAEPPLEFVRRLALEKARAGRARLGPQAAVPVLGADTVVVLGEEVFGKPAGRSEGLDMLARLAGRCHRVLTAVAVVGRREAVAVSESEVCFRPIGAGERAAYWRTGEPRDKAGGYAIQGRGAVFVRRLTGSYSGVMGLPLYETAALLEAEGVALWPDPPQAGESEGQ